MSNPNFLHVTPLAKELLKSRHRVSNFSMKINTWLFLTKGYGGGVLSPYTQL